MIASSLLFYYWSSFLSLSLRLLLCQPLTPENGERWRKKGDYRAEWTASFSLVEKEVMAITGTRLGMNQTPEVQKGKKRRDDGP